MERYEGRKISERIAIGTILVRHSDFGKIAPVKISDTEAGVDFISVGALTHSVRAVDIALDFQ